MQKSTEIETEEFTILKVKDLDWGIDPEPPIYPSMNIVLAMIGGISAIALNVLWSANFSVTPPSLQLGKYLTGEYGHQSSHQ